MIERRELELLVDIAKLLKKHGPDAFQALASSLASPSSTQDLIEILRGTARIVENLTTSNQQLAARMAPRSILRELASIEPTDPQKHRLLTHLYQDLQNKSVLPTLRELKNFAGDCGLPMPKADARQKALGPFIRSLSRLPTSELKKKILAIEAYSRNDNELERWSGIILGKDEGVMSELPPE